MLKALNVACVGVPCRCVVNDIATRHDFCQSKQHVCHLVLLKRARAMLNAENEQDKERFEKLKEAEVERGRDEEKAIDVAARQVKELRKREARSKEDDLAR